MNFNEFLKNNVVILDGAMGTLLIEYGLKAGERTEEWNLSHANEVYFVHKAYFDAGSNVVSTNTFGVSGLRYNDEEIENLVCSAIRLAKKAREDSIGKQPKYIALDIGPTGKLLKPYGDLEFEKAVTLFKKVVNAGVKAGIDLIICETFNDGYEAKACLLAVKECTDLPVLMSNAYGEDGYLVTGGSPESVGVMLESLGATSVGANCSFGPKELLGVEERLIKTLSLPVMFKPNAGIPKEVDGKTVYNVSVSTFVSEVYNAVKKGVSIVGGCCGTTPEYIKQLALKLKGFERKEIPAKKETVISSGKTAVFFGKKPIIIGEKINPTGKKLFQKALRENDIDYILKEGIAEQNAGANVLDVNVGLADIDEEKVLNKVIEELQAVVDIPLQIDTSNPLAMEGALRIYNGKPLLNSVNGKEESMSKVFPLVKKYGASVICLTLDENGIPEKAEDRIKIAKKIIDRASEYGIDKKDLIFDALTMSIAVSENNGRVTLETVKLLTEKLKVNTTLGISNVSFGLPDRDSVNSAFLTVALNYGLTSAIINPFSEKVMESLKAFNAINGTDIKCVEFINFASKVNVNDKNTGISTCDNLKDSIISGLKETSYSLTKKLLKTETPEEIISGKIIPALDEIGSGYEEKRYFLPELLISAESAKSAFSAIEEYSVLNNKAEKNNGTVVLATVKGDIHDIGKNIVKMMLSNYGFSVIDLGKDVDKERVLEAVLKYKASVVGLSALMTTTLPQMEETVILLKEKASFTKVVVGGAVLNKEYAEKIHADCYAKTAMDTVRFCERIYLGKD